LLKNIHLDSIAKIETKKEKQTWNIS